MPATSVTAWTYFCLQGNYDQYVKTRLELEENQMKRFNWEQDQIAHMKVNPDSPFLFQPRTQQPLIGCSSLIARLSPLLLQNYIARFGHGSAKLARQAQSKEKTLQKMVASGLTEKVVNDKVGGRGRGGGGGLHT